MLRQCRLAALRSYKDRLQDTTTLRSSQALSSFPRRMLRVMTEVVLSCCRESLSFSIYHMLSLIYILKIVYKIIHTNKMEFLII